VVLMGKPALDMLGLPPSEVVAVGDSLGHDIGGAQAAGVDSLFVLGGIHRQDVGLVSGTADGTAAAAEAEAAAADLGRSWSRPAATASAGSSWQENVRSMALQHLHLWCPTSPGGEVGNEPGSEHPFCMSPWFGCKH